MCENQNSQEKAFIQNQKVLDFLRNPNRQKVKENGRFCLRTPSRFTKINFAVKIIKDEEKIAKMIVAKTQSQIEGAIRNLAENMCANVGFEKKGVTHLALLTPAIPVTLKCLRLKRCQTNVKPSGLFK
ncbi:uncharacterized protein LOC120635359 isoform X2 [Pararge aegeria]|uniref:uncharacterized protein LOC120635359 isoform X2 n=1 Tax=Pararge aegeria TaxID=116150 RepID=UPI0019D00497|nr:uncharacterized protein LOC120635359 isoform X2 [Pararge aegeria]